MSTPYGKFELLERIGSGGMAEVFKARLPGIAGFEKIVVIKRLHPHYSGDAGMEQMFVDEAKLAAGVQHKNVVQVYELDRLENGELYMAMEYVQGVDLKKLLRHAEKAGIRIPAWFTAHVMIEVLDALIHAYDLTDSRGRRRNIVHRDVSPENIFISHLGDVKLGDFGVARDDTRPEPFAREAKGKLGYMAPEQLAGERLDQRCDVFSAGVVLWECLTQKRLFRGESAAETMQLLVRAPRIAPSKIAADIPEMFDPIVLWTLQPDRTKRTPSARALQEQLIQAMNELGSTGGPLEVRNVLREILGIVPFDEERTVAEVTDELIVEEALVNTIEHVIDLESGAMIDEEAMADAWAMEPIVETVSDRRPTDPMPTVRASIPEPAVAPVLDEDPSYDGTYAIINPKLRGAKRNNTETDDLVSRRLVYEIPIAAKPSQHETADILKKEPALNLDKAEAWDAPTPTSNSRVWAPYEGHHPFWLRLGREDPFGPCSFHDIGNMIRSTMSGAAKRSLEVSADNFRWVPLQRFFELADYDTFETTPPMTGPLNGTLGRPSFIALLGHIAEHCPTGKLTLIHSTARAELHLSGGSPVHVGSDFPALETADLLVSCRLLEPLAVAACMHDVLREERPLSAVVAQRHKIDLLERRPKLMMARLEALVGWTGARYVFTPSAPKPAPPFARSLYALMFELVQRTKSMETLRGELLPMLNLRFERSDRFERVLAELDLPSNERDGLGPFGFTRTLEEAVRTSTAGDRFAWTAAYVLLEAGLLKTRARVLS